MELLCFYPPAEVSGYKVLRHTPCTPPETPQQPIFILQEPLRFPHRCDVEGREQPLEALQWEKSTKRLCPSRRILQPQEMTSYWESLRTFCRSYKQKLREKCSPQRADVSQVLSLISIQTEISENLPSEVWYPFVQEIHSKQRSHGEKKRVSD